MPDLTLDDARAVLAAQPFSDLLGATLAEFGAGHAVLEVRARRELSQQNGFLHGGVLAYAADNAITFAAGTVLGSAVLTGGFTINYLRPALGGRLVAHAWTVHASRRQAVCRCDLDMIDDSGERVTCATAQGTVLRIEQRAAQ